MTLPSSVLGEAGSVLCFMPKTSKTPGTCPGGTYSPEAATHTCESHKMREGVLGEWSSSNPFNLTPSGSCREQHLHLFKCKKLQM